jgi:hypothetical protein
LIIVNYIITNNGDTKNVKGSSTHMMKPDLSKQKAS